MDYKYIEQLIERYWQCQTSLEEEQILRAFFSQEQVPENLRRYAPLFAYSRTASQEQLPGDDFDSRILAMTEDRPAPVRARTVTMRSRLMPLFKAAAVVAIIVTIGNAARFSAGHDAAKDDINYAGYKDTYTDPWPTTRWKTPCSLSPRASAALRQPTPQAKSRRQPGPTQH